MLTGRASTSKLGEDIVKAVEILVTGAFKEQCGDMAGTSYVQVGQAPAGTASAFRLVF